MPDERIKGTKTSWGWVTDGSPIVLPELQTVNATPVVMGSIPMTEGEVRKILVEVVAIKSDSSKTPSFGKCGTFRRAPAGDVERVGKIENLCTEKDGTSWTVELIANTVTQSIDIKVTGEAATINWSGQYTNVVGED